MKNNRLLAIIPVFCILFLMLGMTPASNRQAPAAGDHPLDQALLLMFSSHMRMVGQVGSARISNAHLAALSAQTQADINNEINAVIDLYVTMIANLQASGNYSRAVEDQLVAQMNEKVDALQAKAQALEARRSSRRGGFLRSIARVFNRVIKAVGRGTGWVVGKAMDGAAEVATFAVEEVTPRVLREYALGGAPLNAKLFRHVARELLKKRVRTAAENYVLRLAERINKRQAAQGDALPTLDPVAQATKDAWDADFMEAFEEGDEGGQTDSGEENLNLTPQEQTAIGLHTYSITNTTNGETESPFTRKLEYQFTATGVELYTDGHVYQYTYPRIGPNQYDWSDGWAVLTFTDEGTILQYNDGTYTSVATRTD